LRGGIRLTRVWWPIVRHHGQVTDRAQVTRWLAGYESAWRAPGTQGLAGLFTGDASYLRSPTNRPSLAERLGLDMDQAFTMLRDYARNRNLRLSDLAQAFIDGTPADFPGLTAPALRPRADQETQPPH
jgi:hypothetical protein